MPGVGQEVLVALRAPAALADQQLVELGGVGGPGRPGGPGALACLLSRSHLRQLGLIVSPRTLLRSPDRPRHQTPGRICAPRCEGAGADGRAWGGRSPGGFTRPLRSLVTLAGQDEDPRPSGPCVVHESPLGPGRFLPDGDQLQAMGRAPSKTALADGTITRR